MEKWQQKWILITKAEELHQLTEMKHPMLIDLQAREILNQGDIAELKRVKHHVEDGVSMEKTTFFTKLTGKPCYDTVIDVFDKHLLTGAAKVLKEGRNTMGVEGSKEELQKKGQEPNPSSAEDEKIDKLIRAELDFIKERDPFTVNVHKPKDKASLPDGDYPSTARGKRIFLLVNVIDFAKKYENSLRKRVGAGVDTRQLEKLWEGMGWDVTTVGEESRDHPEGGYISKQDLTDAIDGAKKRCRTKWVDAIAVYVSSHGTHDGFYTSDGEFIEIYNDIVYQFDHTRCPALKEKPKIFFHNACAVFSSEPVRSPLPEPKVEWSDPKSDKIDDAILVYANLPGGFSRLHPNKGSQLAVALTLVFMYFAWKLDFDELMTKVRSIGTVTTSSNF